MTVLDYILEGVEAEFALERELGVRAFEVDRSVLAAVPEAANQVGAELRPARTAAKSEPTPCRCGAAICYLHDVPLDERGEAMISKINALLGCHEKTVPVVIGAEIPDVKIVIALGSLALKGIFPERKSFPGERFVASDGKVFYVTYSPRTILRFRTITPNLKKMKWSMWNTIHAAFAESQS